MYLIGNKIKFVSFVFSFVFSFVLFFASGSLSKELPKNLQPNETCSLQNLYKDIRILDYEYIIERKTRVEVYTKEVEKLKQKYKLDNTWILSPDGKSFVRKETNKGE